MRSCWLVTPMLGALVACENDSAPPLPTAFPVHFVVSNALLAPVTISIDGVQYAIIGHGRDAELSVLSTQMLTWTSAKPADAAGRLIPDDIGEVRVSVAGIGGALEINNVINDHTYITASILNSTKARVSIGVYEGSAVACAAVLPAASSTTTGFVQTGYYQLSAATELRAYRDASQCTGPYRAWPKSQLASFEAKSGRVTLVLDEVP
jgi:hypothetical protein